MTSPDDILITGVGVVSPIGIGREAYWDALLTKRSGVRAIEALEASEFPVDIGADVPDFEPKKYVTPRKSLKVMCREVQLGFSASSLALEDAGLADGELDPDRVGVIYGAEMLYCDINTLSDVYRGCLDEEGDFEFDRFGDVSNSKMYPLWMLMFLPNMTACHVGISINARGPNNSVVAGAASSLLALIESVNAIRRGLADVMVVGGVGNRLNYTPLMYRGPVELSRRNDDPAGAVRPFDADRDGMVNGEGGAALILETRRHAEARGGRPYARFAGYGAGFDNMLDGARNDGTGFRTVIKAALNAAELKPDDVDHVNAHGMSTVESDRIEAQAIRATLGDVPVTAPKSYFGYLGGGSGAVELAASVLALREKQTPPTLNYETPDPDCPVHVVTEPRAVEKPAALKLSQSRHGQVAAVAIVAED